MEANGDIEQSLGTGIDKKGRKMKVMKIISNVIK